MSFSNAHRAMVTGLAVNVSAHQFMAARFAPTVATDSTRRRRSNVSSRDDFGVAIPQCERSLQRNGHLQGTPVNVATETKRRGGRVTGADWRLRPSIAGQSPKSLAAIFDAPAGYSRRSAAGIARNGAAGCASD
jgi:hypothetical protein